MSEIRTYGGWRVSRNLGLGPLDAKQTAVAVVGVLLPLAAFAFGQMLIALLLAGLGAIAAVLVIATKGGVSLWDSGVAWLRWQIADQQGHTAYRAAHLAPIPRTWDLPGVLASATLLEAEVPGRGRAGVIWHRRTGVLAATVLLSPAGALLADRRTVDARVAAWGQLLAALGDDPNIVSLCLSVDLSPDPGTRLADHVNARIDPNAPELARRVLGQIVQAAPYASADVSTRLTIAQRPTRTRGANLSDAVADVLRTLDALPVAAAGAEVLRTATPGDLTGILRRAFDPASASAPRAAFDRLEWAESGPVTADDLPSCYQHDSYFSQTFVLQAAPRQVVTHDVLLPLLSPGRHPRRIALHYRTLTTAEAGAVLERENNAAAAREEMRRRSRRDPTHREIEDATRAGRAAREEAQGAGLVQFTLGVTITASSQDELADARAELLKAAGRSRLKLRCAHYAQAAAFASTLPVGLHPQLL